MSLWDLIITIRIIPLGIRWRSMYTAIQSWILLVPPAKEKPRRLFWVSDHVPMRNWMGMAFSGLLVNCDQIYITDLDSRHTASHHSCLAGQLHSPSSTQTAWYPWRGFYSGDSLGRSPFWPPLPTQKSLTADISTYCKFKSFLGSGP